MKIQNLDDLDKVRNRGLNKIFTGKPKISVGLAHVELPLVLIKHMML